MTSRIRFSILLLTAALLGCSPLLRGKSSRYDFVRKSADKCLNSLNLRGSSWSVMAVDLQGGAILLSRDQDRSLVPASGLKLFVTACALETLGPDFRISTTVGHTGQVDAAGVLNGDLVVIGAGDPSLSSRFLDSTDTFSAWADSLSQHGIHGIRGNVVGYAGLFKGNPLGTGWEWDDLPNWFAAEFSPLVYADDCAQIVITPADSAWRPAQVTCDPADAFSALTSSVITSESGPADITYDRVLGSNSVAVWGNIPTGSPPERRWISVHHPADFFLTTLANRLRQRGLSIGGETLVSTNWPPASQDFRLLFVDPSPTLANLIRVTNQQSQNLYAELLIRVLGVQAQGKDAWGVSASEDALDAGRQCIRHWESKLAGGGPGFVLADGSGLSRHSLASASELVKVLVQMNRSAYRWEFVKSLATPETGTLQGRFAGLPQGITVQAKTGSMDRVRSLSGYLSANGMPRIVFSFICNNYLCSADEIDLTIDNLCQILAFSIKEQ